jgi:hypothetical protein
MSRRCQAREIGSNLMQVTGSLRRMKSLQFRRIREAPMLISLRARTLPTKVKTLLKVGPIPLTNKGNKMRIGLRAFNLRRLRFNRRRIALRRNLYSLRIHLSLKVAIKVI